MAYFYVYASLARIAFGETSGEGRYKPWQIRFAAVSGLCATALGIVVAFVPSRQVESVWRFEIKMFVSCAAFLAAAAALFKYYSRHKIRTDVITAGAQF